MLAHVLLRLSRIWGDDQLERRAVPVFRLIEPALPEHQASSRGLSAASTCGSSPPREIAIVGDVGAPVARAALAHSDRPRSSRSALGDVPLLSGKTLVDGRTAVYVCERFACRAPVTEPEEDGRLMRVCLMVEGQEGVTWDDWVRLARLAEQYGLEGLFRSDHYTAIIRPDAEAPTPWATLAGSPPSPSASASATMVSPATFGSRACSRDGRHRRPHLGGRVEVGMGSGWYEREHDAHGIPVPRRAAAIGLFAEQVESSCARGRRSASTTTGLSYHAPRAARRSRGPSSSRIRRSSSEAR